MAGFFPSVSGLKDLNILKQNNKTKQTTILVLVGLPGGSKGKHVAKHLSLLNPNSFYSQI